MEKHTKAAPLQIDQNNPTELAPLNIIRTETVLSKLPIHNLSKKGIIAIKIVRRNAAGEVALHWEVSPSRNYGDPRALAYKIDTLIINRRLDELGKPLPMVVCLGSLRQIATELGFGIASDTKPIRQALLQNASAFITAKMSYTANDHTQQRLEAGFSRYSVILTGEKLPDGQEADAVYIILSEPYRSVLNNAPVRPLDYDYLKILPPAAQRFYEIVSRRIFVALRYKHAEAKLSYSDYCTCSAQQRYFDYDHFKKQMYKVHRPHLKSGYIESIRYKAELDGEGKQDWIMYYMPGPKARAEFNTFTRSGRVIESTPESIKEEIEIGEAPPRKRSSVSYQGRLSLQAPEQAVPEPVPPVLAAMIARGIGEARARRLLGNAGDSSLVLDQLEWGDEQIRRAKSGEIRNPAGLYIYLIQENFHPPSGFETSRRRKLREETQHARIEEEWREDTLKEDYRLYREEAIDRYIAEHKLEEEIPMLVAAGEKEVRRHWPKIPPKVITELAERKARERIAERMPGLLGWEAFAKQKRANTPGPISGL